MKRIKEVIVVEGKNDSARLHRFFECDTIETGGLGLNDKVIDRIRAEQKRRGVIIFTDPDAPGNRIRDAINKKVPGCKNAFVEKNKAKTTKKVGIEHAEREVLEDALEHLITYVENPKPTFSTADLYDLGLLGQDNSAVLRAKVGDLLHIGVCNARTMRTRLNCLGITKEELEKLIENEQQADIDTISDKGDSE